MEINTLQRCTFGCEYKYHIHILNKYDKVCSCLNSQLRLCGCGKMICGKCYQIHKHICTYILK